MPERAETEEARRKRLYMRSIRRGIKEMDLILGAYARDHLGAMDAGCCAIYDALLSENDHDLLSWVIGQVPPPPHFADLIDHIAAHAGAR